MAFELVGRQRACGARRKRGVARIECGGRLTLHVADLEAVAVTDRCVILACSETQRLAIRAPRRSDTLTWSVYRRRRQERGNFVRSICCKGAVLASGAAWEDAEGRWYSVSVDTVDGAQALVIDLSQGFET
ncbi:MAG: hypothetical protein AMXMBFR77_26510 [Phycisphaerales bacterium]